MNRNILTFMLSVILVSAPCAQAADMLGSAKLYKTVHGGGPEVEVVLVAMGDATQRRILAQFKSPDSSIDGQYNVYTGECETTKCETVYYKIIGGTARNLISRSGYYGDHFELLLPERKTAIPIYYDKKLSGEISSDDIYSRYLKATGRNYDGNFNENEVNSAFADSLQLFNSSCKAAAKLDKNVKAFQEDKLIHVVGMGSHFLQEISLRCADLDYRAELSKISSISLFPTPVHKMATLANGELRIFLSDMTYNPRHEAKSWLDAL